MDYTKEDKHFLHIDTLEITHTSVNVQLYFYTHYQDSK